MICGSSILITNQGSTIGPFVLMLCLAWIRLVVVLEMKNAPLCFFVRFIAFPSIPFWYGYMRGIFICPICGEEKVGIRQYTKAKHGEDALKGVRVKPVLEELAVKKD